MARKPVGYKSPFRKASPAKVAPWLMAAGKWAISPGGQAAIAAAAPGVIGAVGSLFGRSKRRKEQAIARKEMEAAKKAYMDMEFKNPLAGMENPYQENLYEDLTVDTQAADYLKQQQQQSQANIMQQMKGVAGSSGIAGLAQSMANVSSQQAQRASVGLAQQERQNQMLALKGEQQKRKSAFDIDYQTRMGEQKYVTAMEQQRTASKYGLGLDRLSAADTARSTARSGVIKGLGQAAAGVGGTFMPGGINYQGSGSNLVDLSGTTSSDPAFGTEDYGGKDTTGAPTAPKEETTVPIGLDATKTNEFGQTMVWDPNTLKWVLQ